MGIRTLAAAMRRLSERISGHGPSKSGPRVAGMERGVPGTRDAQERIADIIGDLVDDEWELGRDLYMATARRILDEIAYEEQRDALRDIIRICAAVRTDGRR